MCRVGGNELSSVAFNTVVEAPGIEAGAVVDQAVPRGGGHCLLAARMDAERSLSHAAEWQSPRW